jgi:nucleotide-binding universal stress UspA family protein
LLGRLRFWESISIAVAMNTRGAMELVVATIGLSLGLLNQQMYSIIVMVAIVTSFMAPVLLRLTLPMVRMTDEEAARMAAESAKGMFDPQKLRVLVPTAGGANALAAARLGLCLARSSAHEVTVLYVDRALGRLDWLLRWLKKSPTGQNLDQHLERIKAMAHGGAFPMPVTRRQVSRDIAEPIEVEASKGYDLVLVGASATRKGIRGEILERLVDKAPCHVAIVKQRGEPDAAPSRLLVPVDGSFFSRAAVEFAVRYAEGRGEEAAVTIAYVSESREAAAAAGPQPEGFDSALRAMNALSEEGGLEKLSPVFKTSKVRVRVIVKDAEPFGHPILDEVATGSYDLIVLGAENRAIHHRLFFGHDNERLVEESAISVVLVVPRVGQVNGR